MVFEIGRVVVDDTQPSKRRTGSRRYLTQPVFSKKHPVVSVGDAVDDTQPPLRCTGSRRCKSPTNVDKKQLKGYYVFVQFVRHQLVSKARSVISIRLSEHQIYP